MVEISCLAKDILPQAIKWRRKFHQNPELGYQEFETAKLIETLLLKWGYKVYSNIAKTGIVAIINQFKIGKCAVIRVDMDALPVSEETELDFSSKQSGIMHACGHDMHISIGLSLAKIIAENSDKFNKPIAFIFQPAEELLSGARAMINEKTLELFDADGIFGLHIWNQLPMGYIAMNPGPIMASIDAFEIKIKGRGGHGSSPQLTIDPVTTAAQITIAVQTIISRNMPPKEKAVLSITTLQAGDTINVIPQSALIRGSIRTYKKDIRDLIKIRLETIATYTAKSMLCEIELTWLDQAPALNNDPKLFNSIARILGKLPYKNSNNYQLMGSEDAAFFWEKIPGIYTFIGAYKDGENKLNAHHHPKFMVDENAIKIGIETMLAKICEFQEIHWKY